LWTRNGANADMKDIVAALRKAVSASAIMSLAEVNTCQDRARQVRNQIEARRIKPLFAFDFGPADSPVRKDFVPVSASSAYTAESGFGWRTLEGLREVTQPALREPTSSESYYGREIEPWLYLNALTQDLVGASTSAEFAIRVPPGDYVVWLLAGNPERSGGKMFVNNFSATAGATAQRIGLPQPDIFESLFIPAKADADGLTIRFVPETGFVINALAVFAKDDLRRARKEFAGPIEHEVFVAPPELWPKWHRSPNPIENQDAPPASAESARGYVLFTRPFVRNVYPGSRPQADERFERLRAFATPGEYEPFTFAVKPLRDLDGAIVTAEGLRGPQGSRIPAAAIDVRQVRCWPVRGNYNSKDVHRIVPEILDPARPTDLDANVCQRYWLTVHVPDEAAPGMYRGQATIRFENAPTAHIALELEVLPFRLLRDPTKSFGNYYRSPLDKIRANMSGEVVAAIRRRAEAEAIDMREHGMNTLQMSGIGAKKIDGKWEATIDLDERIKFLERFGLWGDAPGVMMGAFFSGSIHRDTTGEARIKHLVGATMPPQEYFDAMTDVIAQVEKVRLARGWPDFYYYPIDEACADAVPILVKTLAAIKKVPTAKTYATQVFQLDHNRALDDVLDVWCSGYFCPDLDAVEAMRKKGRIFWCYPNFVACSRGVPNSARMTYGFALWRMGYSCLIPWHYQAPVGNPFSDFDAHYGDWCMAYPGADGPIPTQRWEAVREGIDDGRYLYTLEARIAAADKAGAAKKAVAAGKALLEEIRAAVPIQAEYGQSGPWQGREYTTYRRRLAAAVMEFD
ncbi:MAG: DUF4091 domain-containing protein, partial [Lentisphaeria bacterium]|nr:DUF4091 domain-containing protein [Lentisphaeria bacterium]